MSSTDPNLPSVRGSRSLRRAGLAALIIAQLATVLALGGVFAEAIGAAAGLLLLGLAAAYFRARAVNIDGAGTLLLGLTAATAVQLAPLPIGIVSAIAPRTAEMALSAAAALGDNPPTSVALSVDPAATGVMLVWMLAVTAAYLLARRLSERESDRNRLILVVPLFGLVVVGIGLIHAVLGLDQIYGFYSPNPAALPSWTGALYLSTFVSPNHLAAFLNLGAPIALALAAADAITGRQRILWGLAAVMLLAGSVMTGSRAGTACAALGTLAVMLYRGERVGRVFGLLGLALAAFLALMSPLGEQLAKLPGISEIVEATDRGIRSLAFDVIGAWPWTGVGRGAFGVAQTQVNDVVTGFTVTYAHNTPLQVLADFGLVVGGVALVAAVMLLAKPLLAAFKTPLLRGAAIGLISVFLHNLIDFNLDVLGVALAAVSLVAALRAGTPGAVLGWRGPTAVALLLAMTTPVLMARVGPEPGPRRDAAIAEDPLGTARRLPGDAYAFFEAGVRTERPELLVHAAKLAPFEPRIPLAQATFETGEARLALIRASLASQESWRIMTSAFALLRRTAHGSKDLAAALPSGVMAAAFIKWVKPARPAMTEAVLRAFPEEILVLEAVAAQRLAAKDWQGLEDVGTRLMSLDASSGYRYLADVYRNDTRAYEAYHLYLTAGDSESILLAAELALTAGDPKRALAVVQEAKISAKHLKRLRGIELRARAELAKGSKVDLKARFDAESAARLPAPVSP